MNRTEFEKLLNDAVNSGPLPGISAALEVGEETVYLGGRGFADPGKSVDASASTVYPIASVTKTMTAHLLLNQLSEKGIHPDTPIREIEPRFALNHSTAGKTLTFEQLIHHFGPLPPHLYAWQYNDTDRETFLFERLPHLPCYADTRPRYRYSNILYALGGWLAGKLADSGWESLFEESIIRNLNLQNTSFFDAAWEKRAGLAVPHSRKNGNLIVAPYAPGADEHIIAPASEVLSSVEDLNRWARYALENRLWETLPKISAESTGSPFPVQSGWRIYNHGDREIIWHSGQCSGYTALLFILPQQSAVCSLLTNRDNALAALNPIMTAVAGIAERSEPPPPPSVNPKISYPADVPAEGQPPPREGLYHNPGYGLLRVWRGTDGHQNLELQGKISGCIIHSAISGMQWNPTSSIHSYSLSYSPNPLDNLDLYLEPQTDPVRYKNVN